MTVRIDWRKAPEWARYAAMDECGEWYWYQTRPLPGGSGSWLPADYTRWKSDQIPINALEGSATNLEWQEMLQERPE